MSQKEIKEFVEAQDIDCVWIGDPCYVIPDGLWSNVCEQTFGGKTGANAVEVGFKIEFTFEQLLKSNCNPEVIKACRNKDFLGFIQCGTMYGDGEYPSSTEFKYGVDSGSLAIVPDYLIPPEKFYEAKRLGQFLMVSGGIGLETDGKGDFIFKDKSKVIEEIITGDIEYEDDDDEYEFSEGEEDA